MAGIQGIVSHSLQFEGTLLLNSISQYPANCFVDNVAMLEHAVLGRRVLNKFLNDRIFVEDESLVLCYEGVQHSYPEEQFANKVKDLYHEFGRDFISRVNGNFSCFVFDKKLRKLFIYTDHLATKPVYYAVRQDSFFFASELKTITRWFTHFGISFGVNQEAAYYLASTGAMIGNLTLVDSVFRAMPGLCLEFDLDTRKLSLFNWFQFEKKQNQSITKSEAIEEIDRLMMKAVSNEWSKDKAYNLRHYALLSGGLDSRCNLLLAHEQQFREVLTLTFSQSGSLDERIARKIASSLGFEHVFRSLDNGNYLMNNVDEFIRSNDGLNSYIGSAHEYRAVEILNHQPYGLMHSGMIGDAVFGSFLMRLGEFKSKISLVNQYDTSGLKEHYANRYNEDNLELYGFEQAIPNGALNGDRSENNFIDIASPFYDRDLISYCLTLPDAMRYGEAIYMDWFLKKHPVISDFVWERAGIKPRSAHLTHFAFQIKRYKVALMKKLGIDIVSMNPFELWLKHNKALPVYLENVWNSEKYRLDKLDFAEPIQEIYNQDNRYDRFQVITLLLALKYHFEQ